MDLLLQVSRVRRLFPLLVLLGACASAYRSVHPATWERRVADQGKLTLSLPPAFEDFGTDEPCFEPSRDTLSDWRLVCVQLLTADSAATQNLSWEPPASGRPCADCSEYHERRVDTLAWGDVRVVRERALLSGTLQHFERFPYTLMRVPLARNRVAVVYAQGFGVAVLESELLAIARSIRLTWRGRLAT